MNFIGGTQQGYEAMAPYRLYLDLSQNDVEFSTGLIDPLAISDLSNELPHNYQHYSVLGNFYKPPRKVLDIIKTNPDAVPFAQLIEGYRLQKLVDTPLDNQITIFVPVNDINSISYNLQAYPDFSMEDILKYHIIDYPILPVQLFGQINRIFTRLPSQSLTIMGTDDQIIILSQRDRFYRNRILKSQRADNAMIYYIEKPLIPDLW
jgi:uncharacterized surface protein with fasciclin (FAS1) repeats